MIFQGEELAQMIVETMKLGNAKAQAKAYAIAKYMAEWKHFIVKLEPKLEDITIAVLMGKGDLSKQVRKGLTQTFAHWARYGSPLEYPLAIAKAYGAGAELTDPYDCESCGYPIPQKDNKPILEQCPLCNGRISLSGFFKKHGCYPSGLSQARNSERIAGVDYGKESLWN